MVLSTREKALLGLLGALLVALGAFFVLRGLSRYETGLMQRESRQEALLKQVTALNAEVRRLGEKPRTAPLTGPLLAHIEQLAEQIHLKDRIQLNALPRQTTPGMQGVEVKVDNLTLDEMVNLLYILENSQPALVIDQFEISPSFRAKDLLRLSLRVLAEGA